MIRPHHHKIILFLIIQFFRTQCYGAVQCYICVWMTNFEGRFPEVDNCRTGKLDTATVVSDSCPYGCHVTIIHEYEPGRSGTQETHTTNNCTDAGDSTVFNMTMTLFARKCAEKLVTEDHCNIATIAGFRSEDRFCSRDYCNGENIANSTAGQQGRTWFSMLHILILTLFLLIQIQSTSQIS